MTRSLLPRDYKTLLGEIKERIRSAQYQALKAVNKELIAMYWDIGRSIVSRQEKATWGKSVVEHLAKDLRAEFPGIQGFSVRNIWNIRNFYVSYHRKAKLQPLVAEIGWTHNLIIMTRCKGDLEREFYIRMTRKYGWSKDVLIHQIDNRSYEKTMTGQTNFNQRLSPEIRKQAKLAVKDEYTFDFLELGEEHSERDLERAILAKMERFLTEMGGMFSFIGSQYRLEFHDKEFFIDLLLFHRALKALVALELKVGDFMPEYIGKMQFYLTALDQRVRLKGENPPIGIILCRSKDRTIVEYTLKDSHKPIGVATYHLVSHLPKKLKHLLPSPSQIVKALEEVE